jgi:HlyD family secretion protein
MKKNGMLFTGLGIAILFASIIYTIIVINKPETIEIQGEVEAKQMRISSKLIGRIDSLSIHRGDVVTKGQLLYTINSPEVQAKFMQAQAALTGAKAQNQKAQAGAQIEDIEAAYNTFLKADAASDLAQKTFQRVSNLFHEGVVPKQKYDEAETQYKVAKETANAAKAQWIKAKNGARIEDKNAAGALVSNAEGIISEVESYMHETRIFAPIQGEIANILAEQGELIPAGYPVVTIVDLTDSWVVFNIREDILAKMRKGKKIMATVPALGDEKVELQISYISVMGNFATWNATKTSGDFDMKTFEVHAVPTKPVEGLRPGMSVLVDWDSIK